VGLRNDGTAFAWGRNSSGQTNVPAYLTNALAIDAGQYHNLAIRTDGTVSAWGGNTFGETNVPAGLGIVVAISAGYEFSVALKTNGTVAAWGLNSVGQTNVPQDLNGFTAISQCLALKSNGTVIAWGSNTYEQTNIPVGLSNIAAISSGGSHSLALTKDGTVMAWGNNSYGQTNIPAGLATEPAIILLQQAPQDRAPEGSPATLLKPLLFQRGGCPRPGTRPACQSALHKVPLRSAVAQKHIDLFQALTQGEVVNVPDNGGQLGAKLLGERNNLAGHDASV
jgi:alpha-tubulin suppressor-like RCC1 family protein